MNSDTTSFKVLQYGEKVKLGQANKSNPYTDITPFALQMSLPVVSYNGFFCQPKEIIIYAVPARTFKDKEKYMGYSGSSAGVSVRVAKGLTLHSGKSGGRAIRGIVRDYNSGDLIITNKRVVFIGKDDSFEYKIEKITAAKPLNKNSCIIQSGRSYKNIEVSPANLAYVLTFISYAQDSIQKGSDIFSTFSDVILSESQLQYCHEIAQECAELKEVKRYSSNKIGITAQIGCVIVLAIAILLFSPIIAILFDCSCAKDLVPDKTSTENIVKISSVTVSDHLDASGERTYIGENTVDGNMDTAWIVNTANEGAAGAWIQYSFENECNICGMKMVNGNVYKEDYYYRNGHVKDFRLDFSDGTSQTFTAKEIESRSLDSNVFYFDDSVKTEYVKLTVISSYIGSKEEYRTNTAITEIEFISEIQSDIQSVASLTDTVDTAITNFTENQKEAIKDAKGYIAYVGVSRKEVIGFLLNDGYSQDDAIFAVDHCGADWNENAYRLAESLQEENDYQLSDEELRALMEISEFETSQIEYAISKIHK